MVLRVDGTGAAPDADTWYRLLHAAGRRLLADPQNVPPFLMREADTLDAAIVRRIGQQLQPMENPVWELAAVHLAELQRAMRSFRS